VSFWRNETGATAIEYALIVVFIATAIIAGFSVLAPKINVKMTTISTALN
jgi:Flp pilus assembly pilin Flp